MIVLIRDRYYSRTTAITLGLGLVLALLLALPRALGAQEARSKLADVDIWGSVGPHGRSVAFVDWSTGNLVIRDLESGEDRALTDKGSWAESSEFGMFPVFSPQENRIAFTWFNEQGFWDLRLLGLEDKASTVLFSDPDRPYVQPHAWSPDGESILATISQSDSSNELALVSVWDGSLRTLKLLDWRVPSTACFVSGGAFVVYDRLPTTDETTRDLQILAIDEGREHTLFEDSADYLLLGCSPGGDQLFFASDRSGWWDVWSATVRGEGVLGDTELLMEAIGPIVRGLGVTREGVLHYGLYTGSTDLFVTSLDPVNPLVPERTAGMVAFNSTPTWSPSGDRLAYLKERGGIRPGLVYSLAFAVRSAEGDDEWSWPLKMTSFGGHRFALDWSTDGSFVLVQGRDHTGREGYYKIDPTSGDIQSAVQSERCPPACLEWPTLGDDGVLFFTRQTDDGQLLVARDLRRGEELALLDVKRPVALGPLSISRDGEWLAIVRRDMRSWTSTLTVMSADGGKLRKLVDIESLRQLSALDWAPDSRHIVYATTAGNGRSELWRVRIEDGETESLGVLFEGLRLYGLSLHPDGRRIALTAGTPRRSEVWVAE